MHIHTGDDVGPRWHDTTHHEPAATRRTSQQDRGPHVQRRLSSRPHLCLRRCMYNAIRLEWGTSSSAVCPARAPRIKELIGLIRLLAADDFRSAVSKRITPIYSKHVLKSASFSALTLLVGRQEGHPAYKKKLGLVGLLVVVLTGALQDLIQKLSSPPPSSLASIKPANPGSPGKVAVRTKREREKCLKWTKSGSVLFFVRVCFVCVYCKDHLDCVRLLCFSIHILSFCCCGLVVCTSVTDWLGRFVSKITYNAEEWW